MPPVKQLLITGGTGFLGRHLGRSLKTQFNVVLTGRNHDQNRAAADFSGCETVPLEVGSAAAVEDVFSRYRPQIVIHAAASKYVDIAEAHPLECIDGNVVGSENVARSAVRWGAELVVGVSTDKACPPVSNLYGMTKAIMERLYCLLDGQTPTRFLCTRFGNLPWSTGSAFPIWKRMSETGDRIIRSTGPHMTRLFIPVDEASRFIASLLNAPAAFHGGVVCPRMKAAQIRDVLAAWVRVYGGEWVRVDPRPGERPSEHLIADSELAHTEERVLDSRPVLLFTPRRHAAAAIQTAVSSETAERFSAAELDALVGRIPDGVSL